MIKELIKTTSIKAVMASPVITVKDTDEFHVVYDKFTVYDIRHLPVVDSSGSVVGLISQRQLYKTHSPRRLEDGEWFYDKDLLDGFILKNVMIKDPFLFKETASLEEVMKTILEFKTGCIIVIDKLNRPVGIVTRDNVIKFFLTHA